jgi:hypothetical protein
MLWDTGSHGCTITADLLPEWFAYRLAGPENDPHRNNSRGIVQVQWYLALSNSKRTTHSPSSSSLGGVGATKSFAV